MWGVGMVVAVAWRGLEGTTIEALGLGFSPPVQVAPLEPGKLLSLNVQLHSEVHAGDIVASIDPSIVMAERDLASATLLATRDRLGIEVANEARRFAESEEASRLTRAQLTASIREDEATVATLREHLAIEQGLVQGGAAAGLIADDVRWELEVVEARLAASRRALEVAREVAANAATRNDDAPGLNEWEVVAAVRAVDLVEQRLEYYDLTADIDGHVTMIYASPGSMLPPGMPVLEIRKLATHDVVAYVTSAEVLQLAVGEEATVVRASGERLAGTLVSVGGTPQVLPLSLWPFPNEPRFGVPVRVELQTGEVFPDEPVTVRL